MKPYKIIKYKSSVHVKWNDITVICPNEHEAIIAILDKIKDITIIKNKNKK